MSKAGLPCFECSLPDCDDSNPRCGLKRALNELKWYQRRNEQAPPAVARLGGMAYSELYGSRRNERAWEARQRAKGGGP